MSTGTPSPPPGQTSPSVGARAALWNTVGTVGGAITGVAALLLALVTQPPIAVLPFALVVLGALAVLPALRISQRLRLAFAAVVCVLLAGSGFAIWITHASLTTKVVVQPSSTPHATDVPARPVPVKVTQPDLNHPQTVPDCLQIRWTGEPLNGSAFAVANQAPGDPRMYFESQVQHNTDTGEWTGRMVLGPGDKNVGTTYQIYVISGDKNLLTYLSNTRLEQGATWWSGLGFPPGFQSVAHFAVVRNTDVSEGCA